MQIIETPYNYVLTLPCVADGGSDEILSFYCYHHEGNLIMDINLSSSQSFIYGVSCALLCLEKLPTMAVEESEGKSKQILVIPLEDNQAQVIITEDEKEDVLFIDMKEILDVHDFFLEKGEFSTTNGGMMHLLKWLFTLPSKLIGWK